MSNNYSPLEKRVRNLEKNGVGTGGSENSSLTILTSQWASTNGIYTYNWNHKLETENLVVSFIDAITKEPLQPNYKIIDKNNILIQSSSAIATKVILNSKPSSGVADIKTEIASINSQLEQIVELAHIPNTNGYLQLPVYNNQSDHQATHPSVLYFNPKWNGWAFWMAFTPYEKSDDNLENPSILVSNDGINWVVPSGLTNPITEIPNKDLYHYSDTELVYRKDTNTLECWYRKRTRGSLGENEIIIKKTSKNGIIWGNEEIVLQSPGTTNKMLNPCVMFENGIYRVWVCNQVDRTIDYFEGLNALTKVRSLPFPLSYENVWHMGIKTKGNGIEMYYCAGLSGRSGEINYTVSLDNITFEAPINIMRKRVKDQDHMLYRPCVVDVDGVRLMYYGVISEDNNWYITVTLGQANNPTVFTGLTLQNAVFSHGITLGWERLARLTNKDLKFVDKGRSGARFLLDEVTPNKFKIEGDSPGSPGALEVDKTEGETGMFNNVYINRLRSLGDRIIIDSDIILEFIRTATEQAFFKLVEKNVAGVGLDVEGIDTLAVKSDDGLRHGNIRTNSIKLTHDSVAISEEGGFAWNKNTKKPMYYNGTAWVDI